jgi:hypothetical protein
VAAPVKTACRRRQFAKPFRHGFKAAPQIIPQATSPPLAQNAGLGDCRVIAVHVYRAADGGFVADERHETRLAKLNIRHAAMKRRRPCHFFARKFFALLGFFATIIVL